MSENECDCDVCVPCLMETMEMAAADFQKWADILAALPGSERVRGEGLRLASQARQIACAVEVLAVVLEDEERDRR